jgi:hypothetical protein
VERLANCEIIRSNSLSVESMAALEVTFFLSATLARRIKLGKPFNRGQFSSRNIAARFTMTSWLANFDPDNNLQKLMPGYRFHLLLVCPTMLKEIGPSSRSSIRLLIAVRRASLRSVVTVRTY